MDRKELKTEFKKVFFNTLKSNGFKKVKKKWIVETEELIKEVDLQKSSYSDLYYMNYSFSVKGIDTSPFKAHVSFRYKNNPEVLDLESNLMKEDRLGLFEQMTNEMVATKIKPINTINDVKEIIKKEPWVKNMLSKAFKEHFDIKD